MRIYNTEYIIQDKQYMFCRISNVGSVINTERIMIIARITIIGSEYSSDNKHISIKVHRNHQSFVKYISLYRFPIYLSVVCRLISKQASPHYYRAIMFYFTFQQNVWHYTWYRLSIQYISTLMFSNHLPTKKCIVSIFHFLCAFCILCLCTTFVPVYFLCRYLYIFFVFIYFFVNVYSSSACYFLTFYISIDHYYVFFYFFQFLSLIKYHLLCLWPNSLR